MTKAAVKSGLKNKTIPKIIPDSGVKKKHHQGIYTFKMCQLYVFKCKPKMDLL